MSSTGGQQSQVLEFRTKSAGIAIAKLQEILVTLPVASHDLIQEQYELSKTAWAGDVLFKEDVENVNSVIRNVLLKESRQEHFLEFVVMSNVTERWAEINMVLRNNTGRSFQVPIRVWKGDDGVYACGGASFDEKAGSFKPVMKLPLGMLDHLPDKRKWWHFWK